MEEIKLYPTNAKNVKFKGEQIASDTEKVEKDIVGIDRTVYKTAKGKYVLEIYRWSRYQGAEKTTEVYVFANTDELVEYLGFSESAKELYHQMNLEIFDEIE